jgi:hypothetical protein
VPVRGIPELTLWIRDMQRRINFSPVRQASLDALISDHVAVTGYANNQISEESNENFK